MIWVRWSRSHTSTSISISVKSGARRTMRTLSMLPSASPISWAIWASVPGSFSAVTESLAGKPLRRFRVDVPGHVDPALVLVILELRRVDLEDADALSLSQHADDAIARDRAALLERHGHVVAHAANGQHLLLRLCLSLPLLPGQRNFRPMPLAMLNQPSSLWLR